MEIDPEFLKGSIRLLLLSLLSRGEMYGYEILQEASRRSANAFELKEGTLYPALAPPGKEKSHPGGVAHRAQRPRAQVLFPDTAKGRKAAAQEYERQWRHLTGAMSVRSRERVMLEGE